MGLGSSSLIVRGRISHRDQLKVHADGILSLSQDIPKLFPEDFDFGETRARETIWERWDDFKKASDKSKTSIESFVRAVEAGDGNNLVATFRKVSEGCKGCHKDFRQKDE